MHILEAVALPKSSRKHQPLGRNPSRFTYIDLFAGIGGMRIPFDELDGECVFSSEWDKFACDTYQTNFGHRPDGDITKIASKAIPRHDILLGGFPCQAFSLAGQRKGFLDTRGTMFFEIQRILAEHRPSMFLLENVKQLRSHDGGRTLETIRQILEGHAEVDVPDDVPMSLESRRSLAKKLNYTVGIIVLKASDFGVPQNRERVYIVGLDRQLFGQFDFTNFFSNLNGREPQTRIGDVLENSSTNHLQRYTISQKLWTGLQNRMARHTAKGNGFGHRVFGAEEAACNTITSRYYKDGREVLIDQSSQGLNPRRLTPRECARIQGFPDWFDLTAASDTQLYKQFGNSVSVPVIRSLANSMIELFNSVTVSDKPQLASV